jgi:hypothetical protein
MPKTRLLHREILAALGAAGHGAQALIADGNYPLHGRRDFHRRARGREVALAVSTGDQRPNPNLLLPVVVRLAAGHPTGGPSAGRPVAGGEP